MRAPVWPEHQDRQDRLERALALAAESPVPILAGNAVELLPEAAAEAPAEATLVVFHTNTLPYLTTVERERLPTQIAELGAGRDTVRISGEGPPPAQGFEAALKMAGYTGAVGPSMFSPTLCSTPEDPPGSLSLAASPRSDLPLVFCLLAATVRWAAPNLPRRTGHPPPRAGPALPSG